MADLTALRRSPLTHLAGAMRAAAVAGDRGVTVRERPFLTMVSIRVAPGSAACTRIGITLCAGLPTMAGTTANAGPHTTLWVGPDEWLIVTHADEAVIETLVAAMGGDPGAVVDVSANRTILEVSGPSARSVLNKGCPTDLHPRAFGPGSAVTTTLGPVPLLLWQVDVATYRLLPRSSFADYTARWLIDAMGEFAATEVPS
jgi:sarcosine oxidase, subunit gamma